MTMRYRTVLQNTTGRILREEDGATAIEYGLVAALISIAIIFGLGAIGINLRAMMLDVIDAIGG